MRNVSQVASWTISFFVTALIAFVFVGCCAQQASSENPNGEHTKDAGKDWGSDAPRIEMIADMEFAIPAGVWIAIDLRDGRIGLISGTVQLHSNVDQKLVSDRGFLVVGANSLVGTENAAYIDWDAVAGEGQIRDQDGATLPVLLRFPLVLADDDSVEASEDYEEVYILKNGAEMTYYAPWLGELE